MKKMKMIIIILVIALISISTAYAVTIIKASDVIYDTSKSNGSSSNVQGAIDELYSMAEKGGSGTSSKNNLVTYITNLAKTDTTNLAYDDTADKNLRYIGANPNNYVEFNGELWRIIGVMNNIKDSDGKSASRVKLIRAESIGEYSWDNKTSGTGTAVSNNGSNDWSDSAIQQVLNSGAYWNKTSGKCPNGQNGSTINCDFSSIGLSEESKSMISSVVWNLGGHDTTDITSKMYIYERGNDVYAGRTITWIGKVGLLYPSDYGYAIGKNVSSKCLSINIDSYNTNNCYSNNWLYIKINQWLLFPRSTNSYNPMNINYDGSMYTRGDHAFYSKGIVPVIYLNTNIKRVAGSGTSTDPYILTTKITSNDIDSSNASIPKIDKQGKLIPVILADDGKVTFVSQDDLDWYNYSEKRWANAVILNDSPSQAYKVGDIIKESDIESYFVWIPKYKYRLWNTGTASKNAHEIDIVFDIKDTTDIEGKSCKTPMTSGATGNCNNGEYMTHPAFISLGVNGFWVGKFETGYRGATTTSAAQVNSSDSSKIIIKPNVYSWRASTVYNFFVSAYNYNRELDSHMMKNTEWGAVVYLSHSKYGINREVNENNNSLYKTGSSALPNLYQQTFPGTNGDGISFNQTYNTSIGYLASTTGNITGIYDMSGGAYEFMASYISGKLGSSGFTTATFGNYNAKYFDVYNASSDINTYQYRILGDATGEMGPFKQYLDGDNNNRWHGNWYGEYSGFVDSTYSWFDRGGNSGYGVLSGQFAFHGFNGNFSNYFGSRIVLVG